MSAVIPGVTDSFLDRRVNHSVRSREFLAHPLYFREKLAGGTRTFVRFRGLLRLEVSLHLLRVLGRSCLSAVGVHVGTVGRYAYLVSGFIDSSQERVWKRGDQEMGSK